MAGDGLGESSMKQGGIAAALACLAAGAAIASIPAPAAPPSNLPAMIGDRAGERVWYQYSEWTRFAAIRRVDAAFEASRPPAYRDTEDLYLDRYGPSISFTTNYHAMTRRARFEHVCSRNAAAGTPRSRSCFWQYRLVGLPGSDAIDQVARDEFNPAAITEHLSGLPTGAGEDGGNADQSYGQSETLIARLDDIVTIEVVTEMDCPAVGAAIEAATRFNPLSLSPIEQPDLELVDFEGQPPFPPPPMGANFVLTFPLAAYPEVDGEVVLRGGSTPELMELSARLQDGVWECLQDG
jgi:hypothetical protein